MKAMLRYLMAYRKGLILSTLALTLSTFCNLLLPSIMSEILNHGVYTMNYPYIVKCCSVMFFVALVGLAAVLAGSKNFLRRCSWVLRRCSRCRIPESESDAF